MKEFGLGKSFVCTSRLTVLLCEEADRHIHVAGQRHWGIEAHGLKDLTEVKMQLYIVIF
jgi:hypothetical protein